MGFLTKILGSALPETVVKYFEKKQQLKQQLKIEKLKGKIKYEEMKTARAEASEGRDHDWELESIRNSGYKDEWVLFLLSIPLVLSFFPYSWGAPAVKAGFEVLQGTPV